MFRFRLSAFLIGFTCWVVLAPLSVAQDPPLRAVVADSVVQPGDTMTVQVHIGADTAHVPAFLGVGFQLNYNPDALRFLNREVGDLFAAHHPDNTLENGPTVGTASVDYSITLFNLPQLADTLGEVARLRFKVRENASGAHSVALQNASRSTSSDPYIPIEPENLFGDAFEVNVPPEVVVALPDDTLETPGPPLQLTSLRRTVFRDPEGDSLSLSAASDAPRVVEILDWEISGVVIRPVNTGTAEITVTAGDGYGRETTSFTATVQERPSGTPVPSEHARVVVDSSASDKTEVGFGTTGLETVFRTVQTGGPVEVHFFSGTGGTSAQLSAAADSFAHVSRYRWRVEHQRVTFDSVDVRFSLSDPSVVGISAPTSVTVLRDAGDDGTFETALSTLFDDGGTPADSTDDALVAKGLTTLSTFKLASNASDNPLPVELIAFDGTVREGDVHLAWKTASEANNAGFRVQRKRAREREAGWTEIGFVEGAGTTSEVRRYRFTDADPPYAADTLAYRLKQIDTDGSAQITDPITVVRGGVERLQLKKTFPNPAQGRVTVQYAVPEDTELKSVRIRLYDVLGRRVATARAQAEPGRHEVPLDVSDLASGTYVLRLRAAGVTKTQRLTVLR